MGSDKIILSAEKRTVKGKKVRTLRRDGLVPATVYERGKDSFDVQIAYLPLERVWQQAGKHHAIELSVGGETHLTMIKDVTHDPVKATLNHVAFHAINKNEKIEAEVPIHMVGQAPATIQGLLVRLNTDHLVVKGLPADMPDAIEVDVSKVETVEDDIRASELTVPSNVEAVDLDPEMVIVSVSVPRAEVEKEEETEEEVDAADVPSDNGGEKAEESEEKAE